MDGGNHPLCPLCHQPPHQAVQLVCDCSSVFCNTPDRSNCFQKFLFRCQFVGLQQRITWVDAIGELRYHGTNRKLPENTPFIKCPNCKATVTGVLINSEVRQQLNMQPRICDFHTHKLCSEVGNYYHLEAHIGSSRCTEPAEPLVESLLLQKVRRQGYKGPPTTPMHEVEAEMKAKQGFNFDSFLGLFTESTSFAPDVDCMFD